MVTRNSNQKERWGIGGCSYAKEGFFWPAMSWLQRLRSFYNSEAPTSIFPTEEALTLVQTKKHGNGFLFRPPQAKYNQFHKIAHPLLSKLMITRSIRKILEWALEQPDGHHNQSGPYSSQKRPHALRSRTDARRTIQTHIWINHHPGINRIIAMSKHGRSRLL